MAVQNFLPLISVDNRILGSVPITGYDFTGDETSFDLGDISYPIRKLSINLVDSRLGPSFVMGVSVPRSDEVLKAYMSYAAGYMSIDDIFPSYSWSSLAISAPVQITNLGTVFEFLFGNRTMSVPPPVVTPNPDAMNPTDMVWTCTAPIAGAPSCTFFDFNWVDLYEASMSIDPTRLPSLRVLSSPPGGLLKAFVVASPQPLKPYGEVHYNTVRLLKMVSNPLMPGDYSFTFEVFNASDILAEVTLTLTITN